MGAAFGVGFVLGPMIGGFADKIDPRLPFWVSAGLCLAVALYGLVVLPESLPAERRMAFSWGRANPLGALRLLRSHRDLSGLAAINFLVYFAHHVFSAVYVLYAGHRHGLGAFEVGMLLAGAGILDMIVQGLLVGPMARRFGDRVTMVIGLGAGGFGLVAMGLAPNGWLFAATLIPNAMWGLAMPTIQAMMTARVSESEQGQLQGATNSVASLAGIASPIFFGWVYSPSIGVFPGLGFVVAAATLLAAAALGTVVARQPAP
jgi:DHA1 family tetracycline resistance protein-like MFS transporter